MTFKVGDIVKWIYRSEFGIYKVVDADLFRHRFKAVSSPDGWSRIFSINNNELKDCNVTKLNHYSTKLGRILYK